MVNYVPIMKWKKGEQDALRHLEDIVKSDIMPFFEIPFTDKSIKDIIEKIWANRPLYFYLKTEWFEDVN